MSGPEQLQSDPKDIFPLARIESSEQNGVRVLAVVGELDISNIDLLQREAFELSNGSLGLVLDLNETTHIDSATIRLLFDLQRGLARRRQALRVIYAAGSIVERVLELTAFDRQAPRSPDRDTATAAIRAEVSPSQ
ncbi:MAG TPA: STAS domain-containing protein [Solirubrobacteraceae bacterium]|jgi:anti-anti-sigma factor